MRCATYSPNPVPITLRKNPVMKPTLAPSHHPNHPPKLTDIRMSSFRIALSFKRE
jgi:hypothetical protein